MLNRIRCSLPTVVVLFSLVAGTCGCGSSHQLADVSGRVTMDGEPLADATVSFVPAGEGRSSFGKSDADGRYSLETVSDGSGGALVGKHVVRITVSDDSTAESDEIVDGAPGSLVPAKYNIESELTFDVTSDGSSTADFDLTSE